MFNISDYLKKFSSLGQNILLERDSLAAAFTETCGIQKPEFEIRKGIAYIKGSPVLKSAVYTKKDAILASLKRKFPSTTVYDIR